MAGLAKGYSVIIVITNFATVIGAWYPNGLQGKRAGALARE